MFAGPAHSSLNTLSPEPGKWAHREAVIGDKVQGPGAPGDIFRFGSKGRVRWENPLGKKGRHEP